MASHSSILIDLGDDVVDVEDSAAATESEDSPQVATDEEGDQWKTPFLQYACLALSQLTFMLIVAEPCAPTQ